MIHKLAVLSGLVISATTMVLHQNSLPNLFGAQQNVPQYNFAYQVHNAHTGDIKSQHESRRGDTVLGQYSLLQPDGIRRTVDYRADDRVGFRASVNNNGQLIQHARSSNTENIDRYNINSAVETSQPWPVRNSPNLSPAGSVSQISIQQTLANGYNAWA